VQYSVRSVINSRRDALKSVFFCFFFTVFHVLNALKLTRKRVICRKIFRGKTPEPSFTRGGEGREGGGMRKGREGREGKGREGKERGRGR
jgi:hypothetical protein